MLKWPVDCFLFDGLFGLLVFELFCLVSILSCSRCLLLRFISTDQLHMEQNYDSLIFSWIVIDDSDLQMLQNLKPPARYCVSHHAAKTTPPSRDMNSTRPPKMPCGIRGSLDRSDLFFQAILQMLLRTDIWGIFKPTQHLENVIM